MEFLKKFLNFLEIQNYSKHTIRNYKFILKLFLAAQTKKIEDVKLDDVIEYLGELKKHNYAPNTMQLRIIALKSFFRFLFKMGEVDRLIDIPLPRQERTTIKTLSVDQIKRILNRIPMKTIQDHRDRAIIELLYVTGVRIDEFYKLTSEDFQFIKLKNASKRQHLQIHVKGKGKKERVIYANEYTADIVMGYLAMREDGSNFLFVSHHGASQDRPLSKQGIREVLKKRARAARVTTKIHPHLLRHSIATHLLGAGANIFQLQNFLGHSSIESTRRYLELLNVDYRALGEKMIPQILYSNRKDDE